MKISECNHELWELIEDSGYYMFQCIDCGLCHEVIDLAEWLKIKTKENNMKSEMRTSEKRTKVIGVFTSGHGRPNMIIDDEIG